MTEMTNIENKMEILYAKTISEAISFDPCDFAVFCTMMIGKYCEIHETDAYIFSRTVAEMVKMLRQMAQASKE